MDILDQEATHIANQSLIGMSTQYDSTIKMAAASDGTVRTKWNEWKPHIEILAGGEVPPFAHHHE